MISEKIAKFEEQAVKFNFVKDNLNDIPVMKYNGRNNKFFVPTIIPKTKIVLHHTAGNLYGDMLTLTKDTLVSVAYIIGRNGTILQLFDPRFWSYHLGKGALGGNIQQSQMSIGIEISNYGWLIERDGILYTYLKDKNGLYNSSYCKVTDTHLYMKTETPYRGQSYFATYTEEQYGALKRLLVYLTTVFKIPYEFLPVNERLEFTKNVISFKGIVTHVNYRSNGKWDVSPAFDWSKII